MDFFDLSKPYEKVFLKGGQSQRFVAPTDNSCEEVLEQIETQYFEKYVEEEKKELIKSCDRTQIKAENTISEDLDARSDAGMMDLTSIGTFVDINEAKSESFLKIYDQYLNKKFKETDDLIISKSKFKILSMIELNEVTIITGPTGCGKTTQVPQYILDYNAEKSQYCNIVVCQPRRIAAITISQRVCEERNWPLGSICGFKVGLIDQTSEDTRLTYLTVGVFLQMLLHKKNMNDFTHIILDEIHERDQTMDFVMLVVKKFLNSNSRNVKVILMSATADSFKFAKYFERPICGKLQPAPIITIEESRDYFVQIHYLEELSPLGELPVIHFDDPYISDLSINIGIKLIKQFEKLDTSKTDKKSVLIFLPGIYEIEEFYNKLKDPNIYISGNIEYKWFPVPLHSSITVEEQAQAFSSPPTGYRKIILATNIAESSITVPDIMFVIDYCLTKILITDTQSNFTSLQISWASRSNLIQRAGRAGRVMDGRVYRMIYKDDYDKLDEYCEPALLRCPLEKVVLQAKLLEMGSPKAVLALALDPPDLRNIEKTILILKEVGGLLTTGNGQIHEHDGEITFLGKLMAEMPIDIHLTKLIALGYVYNCLDECIIIGAAMSLKSMFSNPFNSKIKSYNAKLDWADGSCSDCIAFLNVYDVWRMNHSRGFYKRSVKGAEIAWAKRHFIQLRALKEVKILIDEITERLRRRGIQSPSSKHGAMWNEIEKALVLKFVIAGAFYPNYFTRGARGGQVDEKDAVRILAGRDPFSTVYLKNYPLDQPPDLYSHAIREIMMDCMEDMKISYDHSKVFIEFREEEIKRDMTDLPFNNKVPGKISMAVYRAVKMREVIKNFEIKVLPAVEAKKKVADDAKKKSVCETSDEDKMFHCLLPGVDVKFISINVTHVMNPSVFWATNKDLITQKHERDIFTWLNREGTDLEKFSVPPKIGDMCAAPYGVENEFWLYRGKIEALEKKVNGTLAKIFFIDYGNSEMIPVSLLLKCSPRILEKIKKIPALAFQCTLTKVQPSPLKNPGGQWSAAAIKKFDELTNCKELIGSIYSVVNGVISMTLYKIEKQGYEECQININELLVQEGFAEVSEESYLSKMNNEIRSERESNSTQKNTYNTVQKKEMWMPPPSKCTSISENNKIKVQLKGPFSPLEMKIFSCTRGGASKQIKIAPFSVNCILLDSNPQDPHERLFVAGEVGQNQTGSSLILHNTTIMPNIHGLAALVCCVFAPTVEFRVNKKKTMYTGFLCGLGANKRKKAFFPEHDMEIILDCEFTLEDFDTINRLRFCMSNILLEQGLSDPLIGYPDLVLFQSKIKEYFLKLITKKRESKELEFPVKQYQWGLVEPDLMISDPKILNNRQATIYPVHTGVSITSHMEEKKNQLEHLDILYNLASSRTLDSSLNLSCQICDVSLKNVRFLKLHLASESHKMKEEKLKNLPNYM